MRERETQEQIRREATSTKAIGDVEFAKLHNQLRAEEAAQAAAEETAAEYRVQSARAVALKEVAEDAATKMQAELQTVERLSSAEMENEADNRTRAEESLNQMMEELAKVKEQHIGSQDRLAENLQRTKSELQAAVVAAERAVSIDVAQGHHIGAQAMLPFVPSTVLGTVVKQLRLDKGDFVVVTGVDGNVKPRAPQAGSFCQFFEAAATTGGRVQMCTGYLMRAPELVGTFPSYVVRTAGTHFVPLAAGVAEKILHPPSRGRNTTWDYSRRSDIKRTYSARCSFPFQLCLTVFFLLSWLPKIPGATGGAEPAIAQIR